MKPIVLHTLDGTICDLTCDLSNISPKKCSEIFLFWNQINYFTIEMKLGNDNFVFVTKYDFFAMRGRIEIKVHFPLESAFIHLMQVIVNLLSSAVKIHSHWKQSGLICN